MRSVALHVFFVERRCTFENVAVYIFLHFRGFIADACSSPEFIDRPIVVSARFTVPENFEPMSPSIYRPICSVAGTPLNGNRCSVAEEKEYGEPLKMPLEPRRIAPDRKKVPIIYEYWNSPRRKLSYHFCSPLRLVTRTVSVPKRNPLWYYSPSDRTVPQPEKTFIRTKENVSVTMKFSFFFF